MRPVDEKAVKIATEGRVTVTWKTNNGEAATGVVDGDTGTYQVAYSPEGRVCTCPAGQNHRTCSHAIALELEVRR